MSKKVLITGASGLIGSELSKALISRGDELTLFTTNIDRAKKLVPGAKEYFEWDYHYPGDWEHIINNKDAIIHLAGANLNGKRWSEKYKKVIEESRIQSSESLFRAVERINNKPNTFISSSAVGYYGNSGNELLDESNDAGKDYLARLCMQWESASQKFEQLGLRRVSIRTGIVISQNASIIKLMKIPFKLYLGGYIGNGSQWIPWIHINDIVNIYITALDGQDISGPVNGSSPQPVTMKEFCKTFGEILHRPAFIMIPLFLLNIFLGEMAESITASLRVIPKKLIDKRFNFKYESLEQAFKEILLPKST